MADSDSTFNINIKTTADAGALKTVQEEMGKVSVAVKDAAAANGKLEDSHKKAAVAVGAHAHSNSTLRLATRGANDAAWAITDMMNGNLIVAFHRARGAAEDLGIAMKAAFLPSAIITGATVALELISRFAFASDESAKASGEAAEATEKQADKAIEAGGAQYQFEQAIRKSTLALDASVDPAEHARQAFQHIRDAVSEAGTNLDLATDAAKKNEAAIKDLAAAYDAAAKKIDALATAGTNLIEARKQTALSQVDLDEATGAITKEQAEDKRNRITGTADLASVDKQIEAQRQKVRLAGAQAGETDLIAKNSGAGQDEAARAAFKKAFAEEQAASSAAGAPATGVPSGQFALLHPDAIGPDTFKDRAKQLRDMFEQQSAEASAQGPGLSDETLAKNQAAIDAAEKLAKAYDETKLKHNADEVATQADAAAKANLAKVEKEAADQLAVLNERRQQIQLKQQQGTAKIAQERQDAQAEFAAAQNEEDRKEAQQKRDDRKKEIADQLANLPLSKEDAEAARQDIYTQRTTPRTPEEAARNSMYQRQQGLLRERAGIDYQQAGALPDDDERARQQALIRQKEAERQFNELPAEQRFAREAIDATQGQYRGDTASGSGMQDLQQKIREAAQQMMAGKNVDKNHDQIMSMMHDFIDLAKAAHENTSQMDSDMQRMKRETEDLKYKVELIRQQRKHSGN